MFNIGEIEKLEVSALSDNNIKKELIRLSTGELAASLVFVFALSLLQERLNLTLDIVILYPFSLLIFILLQGSYYWLYCIKILEKKPVNQVSFRKAYKVLRTINLIIILLYPLMMLYQYFFGNLIALSGKTFMSLFLYIFSIIEYINYFYIRLSYNKLKDILMLLRLKNLKKSSLYKELHK